MDGKGVKGRSDNGGNHQGRYDEIQDYLGGLGLGFKVLWDEMPPRTKAFDPENRIIFGVGPLTGTGTPLSGTRHDYLALADPSG